MALSITEFSMLRTIAESLSIIPISNTTSIPSFRLASVISTTSNNVSDATCLESSWLSNLSNIFGSNSFTPLAGTIESNAF